MQILAKNVTTFSHSSSSVPVRARAEQRQVDTKEFVALEAKSVVMKKFGSKAAGTVFYI